MASRRLLRDIPSRPHNLRAPEPALRGGPNCGKRKPMISRSPRRCFVSAARRTPSGRPAGEALEDLDRHRRGTLVLSFAPHRPSPVRPNTIAAITIVSTADTTRATRAAPTVRDAAPRRRSAAATSGRVIGDRPGPPPGPRALRLRPEFPTSAEWTRSRALSAWLRAATGTSGPRSPAERSRGIYSIPRHGNASSSPASTAGSSTRADIGTDPRCR